MTHANIKVPPFIDVYGIACLVTLSLAVMIGGFGMWKEPILLGALAALPLVGLIGIARVVSGLGWRYGARICFMAALLVPMAIQLYFVASGQQQNDDARLCGSTLVYYSATAGTGWLLLRQYLLIVTIIRRGNQQ